MAKSMKTNAGLRGIHDAAGLENIRTASGMGLLSRPALPTMALVNLYIKMQQRERLRRERPRLMRRLKSLRQQIREVTGEADRLARLAMQATNEIRGKKLKEPSQNNQTFNGSGERSENGERSELPY